MDPNLSAPGASGADQPQPVAAPRALKIAVIVMGVVLIVGFIAVFITIGYRVANPRTTSVGERAGGSVYETRVRIPPGGEISHLQFTGDRALVTLSDRQGAQTLVVLNTANGRILGRFTLENE